MYRCDTCIYRKLVLLNGKEDFFVYVCTKFFLDIYNCTLYVHDDKINNVPKMVQCSIDDLEV